jgi:trans-2,3-dihydro-3-hydroxyanthranilate isomerase
VRPYTLLDVFADEPLAGNQLAVVHEADGVSEEIMLGFAQETRLAETTFVQAPRANGADYRVRIWTVSEEVPFAGHPSLGTALAVALRRGESDVTYVQETHAGLQPVSVMREGDRAWASVLQEPAELGDEFDARHVMAAAGLEAADGHPSLPAQMVSTGLPTLLAPVAEPSALGRVRPDRAIVEALDERSFNLYLAWADLVSGAVRARSIPSRPAEAEDPATGSAVAPLLAYLHERCGLQRIEVAQGVEIGRPSRLVAELEDDRVRVGGSVIVIATGELRLP